MADHIFIVREEGGVLNYPLNHEKTLHGEEGGWRELLVRVLSIL